MPDQTKKQAVLVLFAHPALEKSRVNRRLVQAIGDLDGVRVNDLYETYPEFDVDVAREQELLAAHDVIVFQHPFYWYSVPALLKEWIDLVLEHGWAYGAGGEVLRGKTVLSVITAGGSEASYAPEGFNRFTVGQLLAPMEQTCRLCGMAYLPPFVLYGTHRLSEADLERHARAYRDILCALRDERIDREALRARTHINHRLEDIIRP